MGLSTSTSALVLFGGRVSGRRVRAAGTCSFFEGVFNGPEFTCEVVASNRTGASCPHNLILQRLRREKGDSPMRFVSETPVTGCPPMMVGVATAAKIFLQHGNGSRNPFSIREVSVSCRAQTSQLWAIALDSHGMSLG